MFKPDEIIFAPTAACNLVCSHCRVERIPARLPAADAVAFLAACRPHGIDKVGFSGGEPFLEPDFLVRVAGAAVDLDMTFGRLMTNAAWADSEAELRATLTALHEAGFDGTFGVSADEYHGQDLGGLAAFFKAVFDIWGRKDNCEIVAVTPPAGRPPLALFEGLAARLGGRLILEDDDPFSIVNEIFLGRADQGAAAEEADSSAALMINIIRVPYSASAEEEAWGASDWFEDDFCRGPGNVFYVHPDGRVAACCGFANENPHLSLGNIRADGYRSLMRRASESPFVRACYQTGLGAVRERLEAGGRRFPGKTADPCFFCDFCAKKGLIQP